MLKALTKKIIVLTIVMTTHAPLSLAEDSTPPSLPMFDKVAQEIWNQRQLEADVDNNGETYNSLCVSLPDISKPDFKSKTNKTPAWHMDFISSATKNVETEKQLQKLNVLVKAGLLNKSNETVELNGDSRTVHRFRLSDKGWAADKDSRYPTCFVFGKTNYQSAKSFDRKVIPNHPEIEIYNVKAFAGIRTPEEMPEWAQREDIQSEFPIIKESLAGKNFPVIIMKENGKLVDGSLAMMKAMFGHSPEAMTQIENDAKKRDSRVAARKMSANLTPALPAATPEEIKIILAESHLPNTPSNPSNCLSLPGDTNVPVDKNLSTYHEKKHYSVAISNNKERSERDPILTKTIPYIHQLEKIGVMKQTKNSEPENKDFDVYELTDAFADKIDPYHPYCFQLGKPTIEIVDLKIKDVYSGSFLRSSVQYKIRIMNMNPPSWMKNNAKLNEWSELQGFLKFGRACEGSFGFDRMTRKISGGSGSCIKSFDSSLGI